MDEKPKPSPPPRKRHGDELDDTLRKSGLGGAEEDSAPKREGQREEGSEAPRERES